MKNLRSIFVVVLLLFSVNMVFAQGRFGADSVDCVKNLSFYLDYNKQKDWKEAYPFWANAMNFCPPTASQNLYIHGVPIMKYMIEQTTEPTLRSARIDTLLMLFDIRMANYAVNKSEVLSHKGYEMLTYRPDDIENIQKTFLQAVMEGREKTAPHTMVLAMQKTIELYEAENLSVENVLEIYTKISEFADLQVKANPADEEVKKMRQDIETILVISGVASCDKLIAMFEPSFRATPTDKDLIVRIVQSLSANNCTDNNLYYQVVEAYHAIEPSPLSAYGLARMYLAKGDPNRAAQFYKQAIEHPDVTREDKAKYCMDLATVYLKELNNFSQAAYYARQIITLTPNDGRPYMLLGSIWAAQNCGDNEISKKAMFWVAVDYFNKAKSIDPSLTEEANKYINNYTQRFPLQQDAFMYDLTDGDVYTVHCNGLSEQTRVRTRKI